MYQQFLLQWVAQCGPGLDAWRGDAPKRGLTGCAGSIPFHSVLQMNQQPELPDPLMLMISRVGCL